MSHLQEKFGKRLRQLRLQNSMTQEQLAESTDVSVDLISNIERGINAPSFKTLEKLESVLDEPIYVFFLFEDS